MQCFRLSVTDSSTFSSKINTLRSHKAALWCRRNVVKTGLWPKWHHPEVVGGQALSSGLRSRHVSGTIFWFWHCHRTSHSQVIKWDFWVRLKCPEQRILYNCYFEILKAASKKRTFKKTLTAAAPALSGDRNFSPWAFHETFHKTNQEEESDRLPPNTIIDMCVRFRMWARSKF